MGISHFSRFSVFFAILQVIQCLCLIFHVFSFLTKIQVLQCVFHIVHAFTLSLHIPSHTVFVSHFPNFSVLLPQIQSLQCVFLIFKVFHIFLPYSMSYSMFLISHVFQCFSPYFMLYYVSFFFPRLSVVLPYSRFYSVQFSFFTVFSVSCHIPGHILFVSYFPRFSFFSPKSR